VLRLSLFGVNILAKPAVICFLAAKHTRKNDLGNLKLCCVIGSRADNDATSMMMIVAGGDSGGEWMITGEK